MKKLISPKMQLLYILMLISTLFIFTNNNKNNITYISLGDGYAKGKDSFGINSYGYSDYIRDKLAKDNKLKYYTNDYSENDMTIKNLINYISNVDKNEVKGQNKSLKGYLQEADLLTLSIGINDLRYEFLVEDNLDSNKMDKVITSVEKDFNSLIKEIKKYYKYNIYVIGYPNNNLESYYLSMAIRKYNEFLSENKNIIYISVDDLDYDKENIFKNPNSNYYSSAGHKIISDKIYKIYKKA